MDYREFSSKIKQKYPQYSDMDDMELARKMVAKFPQYSDVTFESQRQEPQRQSIQQGQQRAEPIWSRETGELKPENVAPYYKQGLQNLAQRPFQTMFPGAASVEGKGVVAGAKRNLMGALDVFSWPDRAIDYASGGAFERGRSTIGEAIEKIPGDKGVARYGKNVLQHGKDIATSPTTYVGGGTIKKAISRLSPDDVVRQTAKTAGVESYIKKGVDKGIKPTVRNKSNFSAMAKFEKNADSAVKTIVQNSDNINIVNEFGEKIKRPHNAAEFAQAIEQTKSAIYKQYNQMAKEAGGAGVQVSMQPVVKKLKSVSDDLNYNPQIRKYADDLIAEVDEINGAAPEIIENRIKDLNSSLAGFYDGRVSKAKAQIDASVANLMREQLDGSITNAVGEGYQVLKNKYGALKSIEKEVNHRAIVNARRASKGVADLTDIFTGGDLISGVLTMNPALMARGVAGRGIKELYKSLNNPDRYINKMFDKAYKDYLSSQKLNLSYLKTQQRKNPVNYGKIGQSIKGERGSIGGTNLNYIKNSLSRRGLKGNRLLNEIDKSEEIIDNLGNIDNNGMITLYHRTNKKSADSILKSKKITGKEDGIFFSTSPYGQASGYGDNILELKIPVEKVEIDDIFGNEVHLRYPINRPGDYISFDNVKMYTGKLHGVKNIGIMTGAGAGAGGALTIGSAMNRKQRRTK